MDNNLDTEGLERWLRQQANKRPGAAPTPLQRELEALTCPRHGKHPQVTVKGKGKKAEFMVEGFCCDEFAGTVDAYLASASERSRQGA